MVLEKLVGLEKQNAERLEAISKQVNVLVKLQAKEQAAEAKKVEDIDWGTIFTSSKEESSSKTMLDYLGLSS